jgi:hypothetical protein
MEFGMIMQERSLGPGTRVKEKGSINLHLYACRSVFPSTHPMCACFFYNIGPFFYNIGLVGPCIYYLCFILFLLDFNFISLIYFYFI